MKMIVNTTKNAVLSKEFSVCNSIFSKARGLMFSGPKDLVFKFSREQIIPLHMMFVFFQIDVIYLDSRMKVVEIKSNFKPFSYYRPRMPARIVIETKAGVIRKTKTEVGDQMEIKSPE